MAEKNKSSVKTIGLVMIITLVGKLMGLFRDRLLAINYGSGMEINAFLIASRIPRVFFDAVFASAIAASFIPVFSELHEKRGKKEALDFSGNFITVIGVLSLVLTLFGVIFSDQLVALFSDFDPVTAALCSSLTRVMLPTVFFTGIAYSFVGILQSFDEFNIPALISVIANGIIIVYFWVFNDRFGIYGLAIAFLIAWLMQAVVQIPSLAKKGFRFRPKFSLKSEGMKKVFALMLPVMVSAWVQPINLTINTRFGSRLFEGAGVSAIELSNNLYIIIVGVFVLSITNVIFPKLSRQSAKNEKEGISDTVRTTMHTSLYFVIPMMAGLMVISRPLIDLIYGGGEFGAFSIDITSQALFFVSLGMVGYAVQAILCRVYFAKQSGLVPLLAGVASIAVNIVLCMLLIDKYNITGLAISSAVASTVNAIVLVIPLRRQGYGFLNKAFVADIIKIAVSTVAMAAAAYLTLTLLIPHTAGTLGKVILVAVPVIVGAVIYFILTWALRLNEVKFVTSFIKKRIAKK